MAADVGQYAQGKHDDGRVTRTHAVHAIVEVGSVADCHDDECGHQHEEYPSGCRFVFSHKTHHLAVAQVVVLDKRNGGVSTLHSLWVVHHHLVVLFRHGVVRLYDSIGTLPQGQSHRQSQQGLSHEFEDGAHAFL